MVLKLSCIGEEVKGFSREGFAAEVRAVPVWVCRCPEAGAHLFLCWREVRVGDLEHSALEPVAADSMAPLSHHVSAAVWGAPSREHSAVVFPLQG